MRGQILQKPPDFFITTMPRQASQTASTRRRQISLPSHPLKHFGMAQLLACICTTIANVEPYPSKIYRVRKASACAKPARFPLFENSKYRRSTAQETGPECGGNSMDRNNQEGAEPHVAWESKRKKPTENIAWVNWCWAKSEPPDTGFSGSCVGHRNTQS